VPDEWLLELGHTRLKAARGDFGGGVSGVEVIEPGPGIDAFVARLHAGSTCWLAAVPGPERVEPIVRALKAGGSTVRRITTGAVALDVEAAYPGLGVDRWLTLQPVWRDLRRAFCVVDFGSATTIDLVDDHGVHRGGWILPGRQSARAGLMLRAPGLDRPEPEPGSAECPACDTAGAIAAGLDLQQIGAVRAARRAGARALAVDALPLVLTGGDAARFCGDLQPARHAPALVLEGLALASERAR